MGAVWGGVPQYKPIQIYFEATFKDPVHKTQRWESNYTVILYLGRNAVEPKSCLSFIFTAFRFLCLLCQTALHQQLLAVITTCLKSSSWPRCLRTRSTRLETTNFSPFSLRFGSSQQQVSSHHVTLWHSPTRIPVVSLPLQNAAGMIWTLTHSLGSGVWMKSHFILDVMRHLGQNHQLLELFHLLDECRAEQRWAFRTIKCVLNSEPGCSLWHFSDISGERILQTTPRLGWCFLMNASSFFFWQFAWPQWQKTSVVSVSDFNILIILRVDLAGPSSPSTGGNDSLTFFFQNTVKYFDLWASDWPTSSYTQSLWHDTAHLNGSCSLFRCTLIRLLPQRHAWPLHDGPTFWMCVVLSQKSSPKNGYVPFSRCLTEVGLHDAFVWLCETQLWTRASVNVQCLEKKKGQKRHERNFEMHFFFLHFPGEGQNLFVTLSAVCT